MISWLSSEDRETLIQTLIIPRLKIGQPNTRSSTDIPFGRTGLKTNLLKKISLKVVN